MPFELGPAQVAVWLATVGAILLIPITVIALVLRAGELRACGRAAALRSRLAHGEITRGEFLAATSGFPF